MTDTDMKTPAQMKLEAQDLADLEREEKTEDEVTAENSALRAEHVASRAVDPKFPGTATTTVGAQVVFYLPRRPGHAGIPRPRVGRVVALLPNDRLELEVDNPANGRTFTVGVSSKPTRKREEGCWAPDPAVS